MSSLKILIDNLDSASALDRVSANDPKESIGAIIELLNGIRGGFLQTDNAVSFRLDEDAVQAAGEVDFTGEVSADDNFAINGVTFTAKAEPTGAVQFLAAVDPADAADSFVSVFNASTNAKLTSITASNVSGTITLTADEAGVLGNGFSILKTTGTNIDVTNFTGGTNGTSSSFEA